MSAVNHFYILDIVWQENKRACLPNCVRRKKETLCIDFKEQQHHYILHPVHDLNFLFNPNATLMYFCFLVCANHFLCRTKSLIMIFNLQKMVKDLLLPRARELNNPHLVKIS